MESRYLEHFIIQSCDVVKIAEYACDSDGQVEQLTTSISAAHPADQAHFALRRVQHTLTII